MPGSQKCRARGGAANCTNPHCPEKQAFAAAFFAAPNRNDPQRPAVAREAARPIGILSPTVALSPTPHVSETLVTNPDTTWQSVWLQDAQGNPIVYMKLRVGNTRNGRGDILYAGVVLCDMQVHPTAQGKNVPLAALRVIKEAYGVEQVWVGETFSQTGYHMVQKLFAHEQATGEKTAAFKPYVRAADVHPDPEARYDFVQDWARMQPANRL